MRWDQGRSHRIWQPVPVYLLFLDIISIDAHLPARICRRRDLFLHSKEPWVQNRTHSTRYANEDLTGFENL
jgi:hypothetical protein